MWNLLKDQTKQLGDADLAARKKNLLAILIVLASLMLFFFVYGFYSYDGEGFPLWPLGSVVGFSNAQKINSAFDLISRPHPASEKASFGPPNSVFLLHPSRGGSSTEADLRLGCAQDLGAKSGGYFSRVTKRIIRGGSSSNCSQ